MALTVLVVSWAALTHLGVREREIPLHLLSGAAEDAPSGSMSNLETDISAVSHVANQNAVDFSRDVMPIFEASCIGCHGPKRQRADFRVDRRQDFFVPGDAEPLIVPGNADKSRLIAIVSGEVKNMKSAKDHLLSPGEIALLKAWINEGAEWTNKPPDNSLQEAEINP